MITNITVEIETMPIARTIEAIDGWLLHRLDDSDGIAPPEHAVQPCNGGLALAQPGAEARIAWLAPAARPAIDADALARWRRADVAAQLPLLPPALAGEYVPQALDLERLGAIRFDKGCYPGQEIAARLHFRGGNKRRLRRLRIEGNGVAPATPLLSGDGREAGHVLYAAAGSDGISSDAIAVLPEGAGAEWATADGLAAREPG